MTKKMKRGFTLTEIAIVLGIMGLILGAIWAAAAAVYGSQRINNASNEIAQIVQSVRKLYSMSNGTGVSAVTNITGDLSLAKVVPSGMMRSSFTYTAGGAVATNYLVGPFPNGKTAILATSDGGGFMIVTNNVTQANCISLLTSIGGTSRDAGLFQADAVAHADLATTDAGGTLDPLPDEVTTAEAASAAPATRVGGCTVGALTKVRLGFTIK